MLDYRLDQDVAVLTMDDGRANALSFDMIKALSDAFDKAAKEAKAVLLIGREGMFGAGFDLKVMKAGGDEMIELVRQGAELLIRLYAHPQPFVIACTGHAVAGGALTLLSADYRVATAGDFKIGLNEVGIGMVLPTFAKDLVVARICKKHLTRAALMAHLYEPEDAMEVGFVDEVCPVDSVVEVAMERAKQMASLDAGAFSESKRTIREDYANEMLEASRAQLL